MNIKVIGLSRTKIERTLENIYLSMSEISHPVSVEWIGEIHEIVEWGSKQTPTILINEKQKASGRIPSVYEISRWIEEEMVMQEVNA
ncbi:MAG TPA: thioredoxin family protein [Bacteroidota bacterium]|nr:thioredoxin family protein [Bacteroidota bacterium]